MIKEYIKITISIIVIIVIAVILTSYLSRHTIQCNKDLYKCSDFVDRNDAQKVLDYCKVDIHHLDKDKDGKASEGLK